MKCFQGCFSHTAYFHSSLRGSLSRGRSGKRKNGKIDSSSSSPWLIPFLWVACWRWVAPGLSVWREPRRAQLCIPSGPPCRLPLADCSDSWSLPVTSQNLGQELWGQHKQQTQTSISKEGLSDRVESLKEQTERSQNQFLKKS